MEENSRAEKIISQANQWSFEGDCSLLAWMQELSQHLEKRATTTTDALQQLNVNVNRTAIALDNAANSLTALQYTQFVESRCHDDDETQSNTTEMKQEASSTSSGEVKSPKKVLETFLKNNLEMLHNCHEKYALDFEDSDEDEAASNINCIYQPKNPYNDALLPHIYGSKLWKEHWHVGLCDGTNEYSGDDASDAFSQTSSSSAADNESYESNTANLSEWASSTSIPIEHKQPSLMTAQKDATLSASVTRASVARNKRLPNSDRFPNNDDSDTCSTTSHSTTTNPTHARVREPDLFANVRHVTSITSTSVSSSPQQPVAPPVQRENNTAPASMLPPFFDATPPVDIFADPIPMPQPTISRPENETAQQKAVSSQIKRKPVNLFDDDDFNSFMTEVVDKAQTKTGKRQPQQVPVPASRTLPPAKTETTLPSETPVNAPKTVDIFAEPLFSKPAEIIQKTAPVEIQKSKESIQRKPVNLFDSPESSPPNDPLFADNKENNIKAKDIVNTPVVKPTITAKSLFDDDDEDDDFLNAFGSKNLSLPPKSTGKTLLFDDADNEVEPSQPTKTKLPMSSNLFEDTPPEDDFLQNIVESKNKTSGNTRAKTNDSNSINQRSSTTSPADNLLEKNAIKTNQDTKLPSKPISEPTTSKLFGSDLFADDDDDDLDDLFKKPTMKAETIKPFSDVTSKSGNEHTKTPIPKDNAPPLFGNGFEDNDNDLFVTKTKDQRKSPSRNIQSANKPASGFTSLFGNDFEDDGDDLFAVKPTKEITKDSTHKYVASTVFNENKQVSTEQNYGEKTVEEATKSESPKLSANVSNDQPLFEDENLDNETNDLFSMANKETSPGGIADSSKFSKEVSNGLKIAAKEVTTIAEQKSDILTNTTEQITEISASMPTKDVTQDQEFVVNERNLNSNNTLAEDTLKTDQIASPIKEIFKENPTKAEENNTIALNMAKQLDIPIETTAQSTSESAADVGVPAAAEKISELNNQKYTGIFPDEPPDDDDFFTTLASNPKPLSASKLTLDLEHDFYEPNLPDLPNSSRTTTAATTTGIQSSGGNNKPESGISDYGGLRLFSEIPPDDFDDDGDFGFAAPTKEQTTSGASGVNQRLHSVFYDDFSETLEAVQQLKDNNKMATAHALFDAEPPPDDQLFESIPKAPSSWEAHPVLAGENIVESEEGKQNAEHLFTSTSNTNEHSKDVTDRSIQKTVDAESYAPHEPLLASTKPRSAAGKLQMPNIKINVQALLPGSGSRPSFKKSPSAPDGDLDTQKSNDISSPKTPTAFSAVISKPASRVSLKSSTTSTESTNETLLPSICKTRVRAPVGRRPSTRRARQENYRQSLIAEQAEDKGEEKIEQWSGASTSAHSQSPSPPQKNINESKPIQRPMSNVASPTAFEPTTSGSGSVNATHEADLFTDEDGDEEEDDYDKLFAAARIRNMQTSIMPVPTQTIKAGQYATNQNLSNVRTPNTQSTSEKKLPAYKRDFALMAGDDDEGDLFKNLKATPISAPPNQASSSKASTTTATKSQNMPTSKSLFGTPTSEDSDEDLFKSSKSMSVNTKAASTKTTPTHSTQPATGVRESQEAAAAATNTATTGALKKLDSIFGSDDEDDDDFLSNLKPKKNIATTMNAVSKAKPTNRSGGGLFSDIESDEDDLFGGNSRARTITPKPKTNPTTKAPAKNSNLKPTTILRQPLNNEDSLADNPLADLLNP